MVTDIANFITAFLLGFALGNLLPALVGAYRFRRDRA